MRRAMPAAPRRTCGRADDQTGMRRSLALAILVLGAGAGPAPAAEGADPMHSPACLRAVQALQAQESELVAAARRAASAGDAARPRPASLAALQRQAAQACLGGRPEAIRPPQRALQAPIGVLPGTSAPVWPAPVPPVPAAARPPIGGPPLRTVTACDVAGCWTSDGLRLTRAGAMLVGPPGLCAVVGGVLSCHSP